MTWAALMDRIHARLPDGTIIDGVEVFRRLYAAVGLPMFFRVTPFSAPPDLSDALGRRGFHRMD